MSSSCLSAPMPKQNQLYSNQNPPWGNKSRVPSLGPGQQPSNLLYHQRQALGVECLAHMNKHTGPRHSWERDCKPDCALQVLENATWLETPHKLHLPAEAFQLAGNDQKHPDHNLNWFLQMPPTKGTSWSQRTRRRKSRAACFLQSEIKNMSAAYVSFPVFIRLTSA